MTNSKQLLAQSEQKIQLKSQSLMEVWQAVAYWDSRDWSEQRVREAIANFHNNKSSSARGKGRKWRKRDGSVINYCVL
ncbi:hypothetical protein [Chroococcidiopsis sp. SAG 2025]|uniref:hypothetical protein n=1 Tax=Chroococcidiopsis sp. SAG 2025 TaxID=171389 RepID=UPI002936F301|nr:hypothetical protein [Chroococcidiopsis sp. SAG 2025]